MRELTRLMAEDMRPALGVTEPGATAYATALARKHIAGIIERVEVQLNSGMYKNAFTCAIPGCSFMGNAYAAALGATGGDPERGLECLEGISEAEKEKAKALVDDGRICVRLTGISSMIHIRAIVTTDQGEAEALIEGSHTNLVRLAANGTVIYEKKESGYSGEAESLPLIHRHSLSSLLEYVESVPLEELSFLKEAHELNYRLALAALESEKTVVTKHLLAENGGCLFSSDEVKSARLLASAAIEARVLGLPLPAMSMTGSGAHGILATLPLYAAFKCRGFSEEMLLRATALSYLVCIYIKEYSGRLSAFCGCAIAAGTGSACALVYLGGGGLEEIEGAMRNMASSITGMICDGGNHGCALKGLVAVDAAYMASGMALAHVAIGRCHGINGRSGEETMRFMGRIASPGMEGTEKTILEILEEKQ